METESSRPARPPPPQRSSPTTEQSLENTTNTFRELQRLHDSAHRHINFGLEADERGSINEAKQSYIDGLQLLNDALKIECEHLPCCSSERKNEAKQMQQKMLKTKQQISYRLQTIQSEKQDVASAQQRTAASAPPSYMEAMSELDVNTSSQGMDTAMQSLENSLLNDEPDSLDLTNAETLFHIDEGVQIFYITAEGYVSAPSYPSALHVLRFEDSAAAGTSVEVQDQQTPPAFLHVGDWLYPLVPGSSPVLQTNFGAYMFPNVMSPQQGAAVGVILPSSLSPRERQRFEELVRSFTVYQTEEDEDSTEDELEPMVQATSSEEGESSDMAAKISKGILVAADWISWGMGKGAEKAGDLLKVGSVKLRETIKPAERVHKMDPRLQEGIVYARRTTHKTVQVTGYLVNKLGQATSALAREIAPRIRERGEKFIPKSLTKEDRSGKSKLDGVIEVAASGLQGFGTVYMGLESAAKSLGRSLATETVHVVNHTYGHEAGNLAENSMYLAGNTVMTAFNAKNFGVKAIAKRTAKDTGKALLEDMNQNKANGYNKCDEGGSRKL